MLQDWPVVTTSKGTWFLSNSQHGSHVSDLKEVVTTSKGTWFLSNSQPHNAGERMFEGCYYIQRYMIFKQFTTTASTTTGRWFVVTTSKGTWFLSNSQHKFQTSLNFYRCYYIQRYMIFKQFTTILTTKPPAISCYYIQRYMIFKQFTTPKVTLHQSW